MSAPVLADRNCFFVNYVGTDDPGYNAIGAPWSYRSLGAALTALAGVANPPSATNPWTIAIGPGVFTEGPFELPPWVWITGSADEETGDCTEIDVTGNITLHPLWANGAARGGLANLTIRNSTGTNDIQFIMPAPLSGNPSRITLLENIRTSLNIQFEATGTADKFRLRDVIGDNSAQTLQMTNGILEYDGGVFAGAIELTNSSTTIPFAAFLNYISDNLTGSSSLAAINNISGTTMNLTAIGCSFQAIYLDAGFGSTLSMTADAISLCLKAGLQLLGTGTVTVTRLNDAFGEAYTPTTPGNWSPVPTTVQGALDELAAGSAGGASIGTDFETSNAGDVTITPTNKIWTQQVEFTGSARTSNVILSTTGATAGQTISLFLEKTDGAGIVLNVRNGTSGGTLLATFADGSGYNTALFNFVYGTTATGYPSNAWVAQSFQIPATN